MGCVECATHGRDPGVVRNSCTGLVRCVGCSRPIPPYEVTAEGVRCVLSRINGETEAEFSDRKARQAAAARAARVDVETGQECYDRALAVVRRAFA